IPAYALRRSSAGAETGPITAPDAHARDVPSLVAPREPVVALREADDGFPAPPVVPAGGAADAWPALEAEVRDCRKCALHRGRTQTVFGVGRRDASLLIVG